MPIQVNYKEENFFSIVKPIYFELYDLRLKETKALTYPRYKSEVLNLFLVRGKSYTELDITLVIRGDKRNWEILNCIRAVVGLDEVTNFVTVSEKEIAKAFHLQKIA